jgi:hypothetical protein
MSTIKDIKPADAIRLMRTIVSQRDMLKAAIDTVTAQDFDASLRVWIMDYAGDMGKELDPIGKIDVLKVALKLYDDEWKFL